MKFMFVLIILSNIQVQSAFVLEILLAAMLVGAFCALVSSPTEITEGKSLGVLGMQGAGKTTFLAQLGIVDSSLVGPTTTEYDYQDKSIWINNRNLTITAGKDIGGTEAFATKYTPEWVRTKDIIVFVFDGNRILTDFVYRASVNYRLCLINDNYSDLNSVSKNVIVIASHADEYSREPKILYEELLKSFHNKEYSNLFEKNFFVANLRNKEEVDEIVKRTF